MWFGTNPTSASLCSLSWGCSQFSEAARKGWSLSSVGEKWRFEAKIQTLLPRKVHPWGWSIRAWPRWWLRREGRDYAAWSLFWSRSLLWKWRKITSTKRETASWVVRKWRRWRCWWRRQSSTLAWHLSFLLLSGTGLCQISRSTQCDGECKIWNVQQWDLLNS